MLNINDLHDYQHKAINFILDKRTSALFLGLGSGKTISTLTAYGALLDNFAINKVLVISPLRVAQTVWEEEAAQWEHTKHLRFAKVLGNTKQRAAALNTDAEFYLINRENIPWLIDYLGTSKESWVFDAIVVDESSSFKNHASKRFKALKKVAKYSEYRTLLTATPNSNSYLDLWSQFYILDGGARLGWNITAYRNSYFIPDFDGWGYHIRRGAVKEIQDRIQDRVISASYEDLPDATSTIMESPLTGKLHKQYIEFEQEALLKLEDGDELNAVNAAVKTGKLLQFASGAVYDEDKKVHHFHDLKLDMIDEIVEFNPDRNLIIVYQFKHELARLQKRYPQGTTIAKDGSTIKEWNEGKVPMLFIHAQGAGHGIQLQHGGHIMIFMGFTWSLEYYLQVKGRIHRQGQKNKVQFIHLTCGRVEHKLMKKLTQKNIQQQDLLDALKD